MRATLFGFLSLVFAAITLPWPATAHAQNCAYNYDSAFNRLRSATGGANNPAAADAAIETSFGPRPAKCEDGGYQKFLDLYEAFAREAIRAAQPQKTGKKIIPAALAQENMLRLAVSAIKKAPLKVPAKEQKAGVAAYRQVRSNLSAVVEDAGGTAAMNSLLAALNVEKAPVAAEDAPPGSEPVASNPTTTPPGTPTSPDPKAAPITAIRVPTVPLPSWAIIRIYEARDAANLKDSETASAKLQDIIVWINSVTQGQQ